MNAYGPSWDHLNGIIMIGAVQDVGSPDPGLLPLDRLLVDVQYCTTGDKKIRACPRGHVILLTGPFATHCPFRAPWASFFNDARLPVVPVGGTGACASLGLKDETNIALHFHPPWALLRRLPSPESFPSDSDVSSLGTTPSRDPWMVLRKESAWLAEGLPSKQPPIVSHHRPNSRSWALQPRRWTPQPSCNAMYRWPRTFNHLCRLPVGGSTEATSSLSLNNQ